MTVISFPVPPYQNLPIAPQFYKPSRFQIEDITLGQTTVVTTTEDHNYVIGQLTRLLVPMAYGSFQLNNVSGYVISIPALDQVELTINSSENVDAFISASAFQVPQITAIGDVNNGTINMGRMNDATFIPGSFQNISPL